MLILTLLFIAKPTTSKKDTPLVRNCSTGLSIVLVFGFYIDFTQLMVFRVHVESAAFWTF